MTSLTFKKNGPLVLLKNNELSFIFLQFILSLKVVCA
jgi:hypothetical protein